MGLNSALAIPWPGCCWALQAFRIFAQIHDAVRIASTVAGSASKRCSRTAARADWRSTSEKQNRRQKKHASPAPKTAGFRSVVWPCGFQLLWLGRHASAGRRCDVRLRREMVPHTMSEVAGVTKWRRDRQSAALWVLWCEPVVQSAVSVLSRPDVRRTIRYHVVS